MNDTHVVHCGSCMHSSELHDLEDIRLAPSEKEDCDSKLVWRFRCRGAFGNALFPLPCACTNFKLPEAPKEAP